MPSACNFAIVFAIARRELPARKISKKNWITQISLIFCEKKGTFIADFEEKCKKIDSLNEELNALKEKLSELRESVKCTECGEYNDKENMFCTKCGAGMEKMILQMICPRIM